MEYKYLIKNSINIVSFFSDHVEAFRVSSLQIY